jgi:hypothetical protein
VSTSSLLYEDWNRAIVQHFFNRARRFRPVRLRVDEDALEHMGGSKEDLVAAVLAAVGSYGARDAQSFGLLLWEQWRRDVRRAADAGKAVPPPNYIAVLALYVIAVNHGGGEYSAHMYYPRLHRLLGEPAYEIPSISPSLPLWRDLATWSSQMMGGRLGLFEDKIVGRQKPVGYPRRQILLAPREIPALKKGFIRQGLLPGAHPSDLELWRAARASPDLLARTRRLLDHGLEDGNTTELISDIRSEFECWTHVGEEELDSVSDGRILASAVLTCRGRTPVGLHLEVDAVEGLTDGGRVAYEATPAGALSARYVELMPTDSGAVRLEAAGEDEGRPWLPQGGPFGSVDLRLDGTRFRIERRRRSFVILGRDGPGRLRELEERELETGATYLALTCDPRSLEGAAFVKEFLGSWAALGLLEGVQWRRFMAVDTAIETPRTRLDLVGGIPTAAGAVDYLPFALPRVRVLRPARDKATLVEVQYRDDAGRPCGRPEQISMHGADDKGEGGIDAGLMDPIAIAPLPVLPERAFAGDVTLCGHDARRTLFFDRHPDPPVVAEIPTRDRLGRLAQAEAAFRGFDVLAESEQAEWTMPREKKPIGSVSGAPRMDHGGLRLMHLLRSTSPLRWVRGKRLLPQCLDSPAGALDLAFVVSVLHSLGVLEIQEGAEVGWSRLVALPPAAVLLPTLANLRTSPGKGLQEGHQALLVGCWLERELLELEREARRHGVKLVESASDGPCSLIPRRRLLIAEGNRAVDRISRVVTLQARVPSACSMLEVLAPLSQLSEADGWTPGGLSPAWRRLYFDPCTFGLNDSPPNEEDRFVFVQCAPPEKPGWRFFLLDRERERRLHVADRQLGRWFVRSRSCSSSVPVSHDTLFLPVELRLPLVLERALVMSSGRVPVLSRYAPSRSPFRRSPVARTFSIPAPANSGSPSGGPGKGPCGTFIAYPGVYGTPAWPQDTPLPMINCSPERIEAPDEKVDR